MENRYELLSGSISCMYHDIQKIERVEMARYGLKGPHAQCLLAMKKHSEGITEPDSVRFVKRTRLPSPGSWQNWRRPACSCGNTKTVPNTGPASC